MNFENQKTSYSSSLFENFLLIISRRLLFILLFYEQFNTELMVNLKRFEFN